MEMSPEHSENDVSFIRMTLLNCDEVFLRYSKEYSSVYIENETFCFKKDAVQNIFVW